MDMGRRRRTFTDRFKAQVALEAVKGVKTLGALAAEYKVHPNQIAPTPNLRPRIGDFKVEPATLCTVS